MLAPESNVVPQPAVWMSNQASEVTDPQTDPAQVRGHPGERHRGGGDGLPRTAGASPGVADREDRGDGERDRGGRAGRPGQRRAADRAAGGPPDVRCAASSIPATRARNNPSEYAIDSTTDIGAAAEHDQRQPARRS